MNQCSFCGGPGPFTREHVIPRFLWEHVDRRAFPDLRAWNDATRTLVRGQHTVKDTCRRCNNGSLGVLDSYGKAFLESNNLFAPILARTIVIEYDYDLLLRWLLKITFNSARASGNSNHPVAAHKEYIRLGRDRPNVNYFFTLVELLRPHFHSLHDRDNPALINSDGLSNPFFVRLTERVMPLEQRSRVTMNSVSFGGLWFHLVFISTALPIGWAKQEKRRVLQMNPEKVHLFLNRFSLEVIACERDWLQTLFPQEIRRRHLRRSVKT